MPVTFLHFQSPRRPPRRAMNEATTQVCVQISDINPKQPIALLLLLLLIWQSPGLPGWRKVNLITVTRRPLHPSIAAGFYCLTTSPGFLPALCEKWSGFFYVHRVWLSYTRDRRLKVSSERLGNEDKAPCRRALLPGRGSNRGPPVWKSEVLTARPRQLLNLRDFLQMRSVDCSVLTSQIWTGTQAMAAFIAHRSVWFRHWKWKQVTGVPQFAFQTNIWHSRVIFRIKFNPLKRNWFCYNTHFPYTPARVYSGLVFNGLI